MDDVRAVMDAVGSRRAVLLGISEGGPMVTLFAATYPERTAGIVLMGSFARRLWAPDYPIGMRPEDAWWLDPSPETWGLPMARRFIDERAPSLVGDEEAYRWYASYLMRGASPGAAVQLARMNAEIDVRHVLPTIHVPTLVLCRSGEYLRDAAHYMGERIPRRADRLAPGRRPSAVGGRPGGPSPRDRAVRRAPPPGARARPGAGNRARRRGRRHRGGLRSGARRRRALPGNGTEAHRRHARRDVRRPCARDQVRLDAARFRAPTVGGLARAGLHTGEQELGPNLLAGIPVSIATGLKERAEPGQVLVSSTVRDLVAGSGLVFSDHEQGAASDRRRAGRMARPRARRVNAPRARACNRAPAMKSAFLTRRVAAEP